MNRETPRPLTTKTS